MIERILQKLYDEYYPDRDIQVLIVNGRVTLAINDTAQASYSIKGTYRYEEVQKLNQFTKKKKTPPPPPLFFLPSSTPPQP